MLHNVLQMCENNELYVVHVFSAINNLLLILFWLVFYLWVHVKHVLMIVCGRGLLSC